VLFCFWRSAFCGGAGEATVKSQSALFPPELTERAKANAGKYRWAAEIRDRIVADAAPWRDMSNDRLWSLMFGSTISRSWMVWSDGFCPACKEKVPMYNWKIDALERPWKVRCPHCRELFPKNDFRAFYRSGLNERGVFDPKRADRTLLFNAAHPEPGDPLRAFGVDDGDGFVQGRHRWRFIGAYLIYGHWKQLILGGIEKLSAAYTVTGDPVYARKAGILLDRVADLYPTFDFKSQGLVYEKRHPDGYVSVWHDAAKETWDLTLAYDRVFEGMRSNKELVDFLKDKAAEYKVAKPKACFDDIQRNIEGRILREALAHPAKIKCNVPITDLVQITIRTVLDWPRNREAVLKQIAGMINRHFRVDGTTGEKGLSSYCSIAQCRLAWFLERYAVGNPEFLPELRKRCPTLTDGFGFFIDTWLFGQYYPNVGDAGSPARRETTYRGVYLSPKPFPVPSMTSFLWRLYELSGDPAFVRVLFQTSGDAMKDLPNDILAPDPENIGKRIQDVMDREGRLARSGSMDKKQWHLGILRSGQGRHGRAVWMNYDSGGNHGHADGMNLGLVSKGLNLMPDLGYRPVQFGGWYTARATWYVKTACHNTVVVDGKDHPLSRRGGLQNPLAGIVAGRTTLWADGERFRAMRASGAKLIGGKQYERTVCLVDISDEDSYVLDIFRVAGGKDHTKFMHSAFGALTTHGLSLAPASPYGHGTLLKDFKADLAAAPGWWADWKIEDIYGYLEDGRDVHLRYTDLTTGAQAWTAMGWLVAGGPTERGDGATRERWEPWLFVRRQADDDTPVTTFVGVIEPYEGTSHIAAVRRLPLETAEGAKLGDAHVAVEIALADGRRDLIVAVDAENPLNRRPALPPGAAIVQKDWNVRTDAQLCWVRREKNGQMQRIEASP
jgi:oligo-alginate lyase